MQRETEKYFPHSWVGSFLTQSGQAFPRVLLSYSNTGSFIFLLGVCKPVRCGEKAGEPQQSSIPG